MINDRNIFLVRAKRSEAFMDVSAAEQGGIVTLMWWRLKTIVIPAVHDTAGLDARGSLQEERHHGFAATASADEGAQSL